MGYYHEGLPEFITQYEKHFMKLLFIFGIEVPGGFIGQNNFGARDDRSSHLEFGWSRPHGANRRCHTPRLLSEPRIRGAIPRADFRGEQSGQPNVRGLHGTESVDGD